MDFMDTNSVKSGIQKIKDSIDGVILNAGGMGGKEPGKKTKSGMNFISATNLLGHAVLVEELLKAGKIKNRVVFVSSEAARGVPSLGMKRPNLKSSSEEEFASVLDGSFFGKKLNPGDAYGSVKYIGTLWTSSLSRKNPDVEFISISPGSTKGTAVADNVPGLTKFMFKYIFYPIILPLKGMVHSVEKGAARYVRALTDSTFISGEFYGSRDGKLTGELVKQSTIFSDLKNQTYQDNAYNAIQRFIEAE